MSPGTKPYFQSLRVESGGIGAGTAITFQMRLMGRTRSFAATVTEPQPGKVLLETVDTGALTTFTVEPRDDGRRSAVTIATETRVSGGILGAVRGWFLSRLLKPIYEKELALLAEFAAKPAQGLAT